MTVKAKNIFKLTSSALLLLAFVSGAFGQSSGGSFQVTSSVIGGGGGTSSDAGGVFKVEGTAGEPVAYDLSHNSPYALRSGLWYTTLGLTPTAATSNISGQVFTTDGRPLAGVVMTLVGARSASTITDAEGKYLFEEVESGSFYSVTPLRVNYSFAPASLSFSLLANKTDAVFAAQAVADSANPLDTPEFFVRQQYLDFLSREPDAGGLGYWSSEISKCQTSFNAESCLRARRVDVSAAFFIEQEFQQTGFFIYRLYRASFGQRPGYANYMDDRLKISAGAQLESSQAALLNDFVARSSFKQMYPDSLSADEFVTRLYEKAGLSSDAVGRAAEIAAMQAGKLRAGVLRDVIETTDFKAREYNPSFVLMQYFGYLRREPDEAGYQFWLDVLNNREPNNYRGMVCSFLTSAEYQKRFSSVVTRSNSECGK